MTTQTKVGPLRQIMSSAFRRATPARLRLFLIVDCIVVVAFCSFTVMTVKQHEHAGRTIGKDAGPSVIAAHEVKMAIQQMDACLSSQLLYKSDSNDSKIMEKRFEPWRIALCKHVVIAAKNITYGASEQVPIEDILGAFGRYLMQVQRTRDFHNAGNSAAALAEYRETLRTINKELVPAANALDKANFQILDSIYSGAKSNSKFLCGLVLFIGMLCIICLVVTQFYLFKRFRRRFNLPLLIATVASAFVVMHMYSELSESGEAMKVAKELSYDSILTLLDVRASAYNANAAQSRWLLDRENAALHDKEFHDNVNAMISFSPGHSFDSTILLAEAQLANRDHKFKLPGFSGTLATEFQNVSFEGEKYHMVEALKALKNFCAVDKQMRELEKAGNHDAAVELGLEYDPEASKSAFTKLDYALGTALRINLENFELAVDDAETDLRGLAILAEFFAVFVVVFVYFGLRSRMAEYINP